MRAPMKRVCNTYVTNMILPGKCKKDKGFA